MKTVNIPTKNGIVITGIFIKQYDRGILCFSQERLLLIDENGNEHEVRKGQSLFVKPNEKHQFRNPYNEDFEFTCIIPNPEKK